MIIVFLCSILILNDTNSRLSKYLDEYIDLEAERVISYVVTDAIKELGLSDLDNYLDTSSDNFKYNIENITEYKNKLSDKIQDKFYMIEKGDFRDSPILFHYDKKKYKNIKYGYLCEVNFNSIRNLFLFGNLGPNIPIKLSFLSTNNVEIEFDIKEYGINNVIVKMYAEVEVSNKVTMPISSKNHRTKVREVIGVDIIKGSVPSYYSKYT